jgi:two-component system OmpR family sensor kinase
MSLRARLLVGMAVIAVVLGIAAVAIARTTEDHLVAQVDARLTNADTPLNRPDRGDDHHVGGPEPEHYSDVYVGVVTSDKKVTTVVTPNLTRDSAGTPLPEIDGADAIKRAADKATASYTVSSVGGGPHYRVYVRPETGYRLEATGVQTAAVVTALPLSDVGDAVHRLIVVEAAAVLAVLAVLGMVAWWVIRLGVRPLKAMTATATAIGAGELTHRVPDGAAGTEAGELGSALNNMLTRIEEAFDERARSELRLRQFIADASHELRTPVTTIRGYAELYRSGGLDKRAELDEAMRRTEAEAVRMGSLVDDLLHLARLDQGRPLERDPVDLAAIAADAVQDARAVDPQRPITAYLGDEQVTVVGDDPRLRQVVANLIGNALVHTPPGTPVDVRVARRDGHGVLEVIDLGPGMDAAVAARAFERFYRADASRSRHRGGSGLGLAIVEATVRAHGGNVSLTSTSGQGTTVTVEIPLAGSA